jgi:hypothetical protein
MPQSPRTRKGKRPFSRLGDLSWTLIETAGGWAETSERLSPDERDELIRLRKKRAPLSKAERAKFASLVVRAVGAERLRGLLDRGPAEPPKSPREPSDLDAAERLKRAAKLRDDGIITEDDFQELKAGYLKEL